MTPAGSRGTRTSPGTFNYAPIAVGGTLLLFGGWWVLSAQVVQGPGAQGTEEDLARIEAQYESGAAPRSPRHRLGED